MLAGSKGTHHDGKRISVADVEQMRSFIKKDLEKSSRHQNATGRNHKNNKKTNF